MIETLHDGFWRLFLTNLVCLNYFAVMVLSNYSLLRSRWFLKTIFQDFGVSKPFESSALLRTTVTVVKSYTHSLQFSLLMLVSAKDGSYYAQFVP
jgi:hypothetical protein